MENFIALRFCLCSSARLFLNNQLSPGSGEPREWTDFRFIYIYSFHQPNRHLLSTYYVLDTVISLGIGTYEQKDNVMALLELTF